MSNTVPERKRRAQLRTAEAEYNVAITGAAEGLGMQSMMMDLELGSQVRVWTDSNAAQAIASRKGLGKTRHIELKYQWLQEVTKSRRAKMKRTPGVQNLAEENKFRSERTAEEMKHSRRGPCARRAASRARRAACWPCVELNVLRGVRQALGNQSAMETLEANSSTWLDTRQLHDSRRGSSKQGVHREADQSADMIRLLRLVDSTQLSLS